MLKIDPFPYQDSAIDMGLERGNLLIAYGMGLGKTIIQLGISETLLGDGEVKLNALVVPASLKWQWAQAIAWATDVKTREVRMKDQLITVPTEDYCVVLGGTGDHRDRQYRQIREHRPDYVIMGYKNVLNDWRQVRAMEPDLICLDEATAIKTFSAATTLNIKKWDAPFRYALTGTPIDNKADELFSIMEWVDPDELGRADLFDKAFVTRDGYGRVKRYKHLDELHLKTKRFCARKTRFDPDVSPFLPKDYHKEIYVGLSVKAKALYKKIASVLAEELEEMVGDTSFSVEAYYGGDKMNGNSQQGSVMSKIMALNMLCDHPGLLEQSALNFDRWMESGKGPSKGSKYAWELWKNSMLDFSPTSPKFDAVASDTADLLLENDQSKIIIFSFYKEMGRLFQTRFGEQAVIFNGDMSIAEKEAAKMRFKRDADVRVFLSSDAGGMGVDLPEANYLINYDLPDSAGKSDQRNNRHVRAGSKWAEVFIINYLVEDSIEMLRFERLDFKRRVGSAILDGGKTEAGGQITNDVATLRDFLLSV